MAPLSHQLAGVILDYEHFGSHLDSQKKTVDIELEKQNFKYAGEVLCDLWNDMMIDKYPVFATYVDPEEADKINDPDKIDHFWFAKHVRSSQYLLQIVKCNDESCCKKYRSNLRTILPNGFLPPPVKVKPNKNGILEPAGINDKTGKFLPLFQLLATNIEVNRNGASQVLIFFERLKFRLNYRILIIIIFFQVPYDFYCTSINSQIFDRICNVCGLYFATKKAVEAHLKCNHDRSEKSTVCRRVRPINILKYRNLEALCTISDDHTGEENVEWIDVEGIDDTELVMPTECIDSTDTLPVIDDLQVVI